MGNISLGGSTDNMHNFLQRLKGPYLYANLEELAREGVAALEAATPKESGETAQHWGYRITTHGDKTTIVWINDHDNEGVNIAVLLQYGHYTGTGGWVQGRDYINPAIKPILDKIGDDVWRKVTLA